jgi:hypothetical protein
MKFGSRVVWMGTTMPMVTPASASDLSFHCIRVMA